MRPAAAKLMLAGAGEPDAAGSGKADAGRSGRTGCAP